MFCYSCGLIGHEEFICPHRHVSTLLKNLVNVNTGGACSEMLSQDDQIDISVACLGSGWLLGRSNWITV